MKHLYLSLLLFLFAGTVQVIAQPFYVKMRPLEGYFVNEKYPLKKGLNFFVITNDRQFEKMFGKIDKPEAPNFEMERVIVIAYPPTDRAVTLGLYPKVAKAGNYMEVFCTANETKEKLPYTAYPVVVAAVPIYFAVKEFKLYDEASKKMLASVKL